MSNDQDQFDQTKEELGEDPTILAEIAEATAKLEGILKDNQLDVDYCEADWKDTESLITESHRLIRKHPGWQVHYFNGDEFGIDANYVFFTSKPVEHSLLLEIANLIVNEGAELPGPVAPKCPKCGMEIECLAGVYPATIPAVACIVNGELYIDTVDGIKISDCIGGDVEAWHCSRCDEELFKAGEEHDMVLFLREGVYKEESGERSS